MIKGIMREHKLRLHKNKLETLLFPGKIGSLRRKHSNGPEPFRIETPDEVFREIAVQIAQTSLIFSDSN